eukprot:1670806-Pleurochrysis_carterae.AAC.3
MSSNVSVCIHHPVLLEVGQNTALEDSRLGTKCLDIYGHLLRAPSASGVLYGNPRLIVTSSKIPTPFVLPFVLPCLVFTATPLSLRKWLIVTCGLACAVCRVFYASACLHAICIHGHSPLTPFTHSLALL